MTEEFKPTTKADLFENIKPKTAFFIGLIGGFLVLSAIGFFIMLAVNLSGGRPVAQVQPSPAQLGAQANGAVEQPNYQAIPAVNNNDNILGNKKAKVTLIEYSDFECPYCQKVGPTLQQVLQAYGDQVRLVYRHFPLSIHPYAEQAAEASQCAAEQDKFWPLHDKFFAEQAALSATIKPSASASVPGRVVVAVQTQNGIQYADITDTIALMKQYAAELSLNTSKFNSCLDEKKTASRVAEDLQQAATALPADLQGTPAIFINNKEFIAGAYPFEKFKQIIDGLLAE